MPEKQRPESDPSLFYRYDGVDEDGQHWLERLENGEPTEDYIPIRMGAYERDDHA